MVACYLQLNAKGFEAEVEGVIKKHFQDKIDMSAVVACRKEIQSISDRYQKGKFLKERREVLVPFLNTRLVFTVHDPSSEVELRVQASLKSKAMGSKDGLPLLEHERWCAPEFAKGDEQCVVDAGLLAECLAARKCLADMLEKEHGVCLEDVRRCFRKNSSMLVGIDRSVKLESEYIFQKGDELMTAAVEKSVVATLPSKDVRRSLPQSIGLMEALRDDRVFMFAPRDAQNRAEAVLELLRNMTKGISPSAAPQDKSSFWAAVWSALPMFLRSSRAGASGSASSADLVGRKALEAEMEKLKERFKAAKPQVKLQELEQLQPYKWLMTVDETQAFAKWVETTLTDITEAAGAVTRLGKSVKEKKSAARGSSSSNSKDGSASVMHFFH